MAFESLTIIGKYAIPAMLGASTKTYFDYTRKIASKKQLVKDFLLNSLFALVGGGYAAHTFVIEYPHKEHLSYPLAYCVGALSINIITALLSMNWDRVVELVRAFRK